MPTDSDLNKIYDINYLRGKIETDADKLKKMKVLYLLLKKID